MAVEASIAVKLSVDSHRRAESQTAIERDRARSVDTEVLRAVVNGVLI